MGPLFTFQWGRRHFWLTFKYFCDSWLSLFLQNLPEVCSSPWGRWGWTRGEEEKSTEGQQIKREQQQLLLKKGNNRKGGNIINNNYCKGARIKATIKGISCVPKIFGRFRTIDCAVWVGLSKLLEPLHWTESLSVFSISRCKMLHNFGPVKCFCSKIGDIGWFKHLFLSRWKCCYTQITVPTNSNLKVPT